MFAKLFFVLVTIACVQVCFGDFNWSEEEIKNEISDIEIAALRSYMLTNLNAKTETVDVLIQKFIKLNRGRRDGNDIFAFRNYLLNIPGAKADAVHEFLEIYKAHSNERSHWAPISTFGASLVDSLDGVSEIVNLCACCQCDDQTKQCQCTHTQECSQCEQMN